MGVSNIARQEETGESVDIVMNTYKLEDVEKLENTQVSIQEESIYTG